MVAWSKSYDFVMAGPPSHLLAGLALTGWEGVDEMLRANRGSLLAFTGLNPSVWPMSPQSFDPAASVLLYHSYAGSFRERRHHFPGEAEDGRLVGRRVPHDQRSTTLGQRT